MEEDHGSPFQYSCLENSMDRGAWQATVLGVTESDTREVSEHTHTHEGELEPARLGDADWHAGGEYDA